MKQTSSKESLGKQATVGVLWSAGGNGAVNLIRFCSTIIVARILMPEDFGIVGSATLFWGFLMLASDLGIGAALIHSKELNDKELSTAFWSNLGIGIFLTLLTFILSPLVSMFFQNEKVGPIFNIMGFTFIFSALASIHSTLLAKNVHFKQLSVIGVICSIARVIAILSFVWAGMGYWSIVYAILTERILRTILVVSIVKWRPLFVFDLSKLKTMLSYGKNIYGHSIVMSLNNQWDSMAIGRFLGPESLGFYQLAMNLLSVFFNLVVQSVESVMFPVFAKIQDDKDRLRRGFYKTLKIFSLGLFPILFGLMAVSDLFITAVYSVKWLPASTPLVILSAAMVIRSVFNNLNPLLRAIGKPDILFQWNFWMLPFTAGIIFISVHWGVNGVAAGVLVSGLLYIPMLRKSLKLISGSMNDVLKNLFPAFLSSLVMYVMIIIFRVFVMMPNHPIISLMMCIVLGVVVYGASYFIFFKEEFKEMLTFVKNLMDRQKRIQDAL